MLTQVAQFSEHATFSIDGRLGVILANETENFLLTQTHRKKIYVCATFSYPRQPTFQKSRRQDSLSNLSFMFISAMKMRDLFYRI